LPGGSNSLRERHRHGLITACGLAIPKAAGGWGGVFDAPEVPTGASKTLPPATQTTEKQAKMACFA